MILVIYHKHCMDGTAAAWVCGTALGFENVEFHAASYGEPPPDVTTYDAVYIVDFSYKRDVMEKLFASNHDITLIDHHKTAVEELALWEGDDRVTFDMNHSGAMLCWKHFFDESQPPEFLAYIEDRDLWKWELPNSKEVNADLSLLPRDPVAFDDVARRLDIESCVMRGDAILAKERACVARMAQDAVEMTVQVGSTVHSGILCAMGPCLHSELGHALMQRQGDFAITWRMLHDLTVEVSLRGKGVVDCSQIAKTKGGGGHKNAAGFRVSWAEWAVTLTSRHVICLP